MLLHFLLVTVAPGCLVAGWWQVHRALSGNLLSYFYSVEWPIFSVLAVVAWWQLVHDQPTVEDLAWDELGDDEASGEVAVGADGDGDVLAPGPAVARGRSSRPWRQPKRRKSWLYHQDTFEGARVVWDRSQESSELVEYNRYLQSLATGRARKTWSNPRGLPETGEGAARP